MGKTVRVEAPLACNLGAFSREQGERHRLLLQDVLGRVRRVQELPEGIAFELEWITLERLRCPFLAFRLDREHDAGPIRFRPTGPPGVKRFLRAFVDREDGGVPEAMVPPSLSRDLGVPPGTPQGTPALSFYPRGLRRVGEKDAAQLCAFGGAEEGEGGQVQGPSKAGPSPAARPRTVLGGPGVPPDPWAGGWRPKASRSSPMSGSEGDQGPTCRPPRKRPAAPRPFWDEVGPPSAVGARREAKGFSTAGPR